MLFVFSSFVNDIKANAYQHIRHGHQIQDALVKAPACFITLFNITLCTKATNAALRQCLMRCNSK